MQRGFTEEGSKLAIGIIGNTDAGEDPLLSANLVRQAQAIVARTATGEILCETQIQAALQRQRGDNGGNSAQAVEELHLVRLVTPEAEFETAPPAQAPESRTSSPAQRI